MARPRPIEILLVEDNEPDYELTKRAFENEFVTNVSRVKTGEEAMRYLKREGEFAGGVIPDIVLLDINLPGMSGLDVLAAIREDAELSSVAVIMLTVSDDPQDVRRAYALHANCFVTKPVDLVQFYEAMRSFSNFWLRFAQPPVH